MKAKYLQRISVAFSATKSDYDNLKQQGRVELDDDWNELEQILRKQKLAPDERLAIISGSFYASPPSSPRAKSNVFNALQDAGEKIIIEVNPVRRQVIASIQGPRSKQPDPTTTLPTSPQGTCDVVYLDVWECKITAIEDPGLEEPATDSPDTSQRKPIRAIFVTPPRPSHKR
jgi:hypothetical protein